MGTSERADWGVEPSVRGPLTLVDKLNSWDELPSIFSHH